MNKTLMDKCYQINNFNNIPIVTWLFKMEVWIVTLSRGNKLEPKAKPMRMVGCDKNGYAHIGYGIPRK